MVVYDIDEVLVDAVTPEVRVARLNERRLIEFNIFRSSQRVRTGDIIVGRIKTMISSLGSAFVDIGDIKDGFLPLKKNQKRIDVTEGSQVIVQVRHERYGEKGARLTQNISIVGHLCIFKPLQPGIFFSKKISDQCFIKNATFEIDKIIGPNEGVLIRTSTPLNSADDINQVALEIEKLRKKWLKAIECKFLVRAPFCLISAPDPIIETIKSINYSRLKWIRIEGADMFRRFRGAEKQFGLPFGSRLIQYKEKEEIMGLYDVKTQLDEALSPSVFLPSGGQLHITETPACITVDVDTGLSDRIKGRKFVRDTNLEAAQMLARQIRLRNLGGKIIVDFVRNKNRKDGQILIDTLKVELSSDENSTSVLGFTKLGLLELLRSRRSMSLNDLMLEHETFGALRKRNFMTIAYEVLRQIDKTARFYPGRPITVRAHCRVKDILNNDLRGDLNKAIEKIGIPILLTDDDNISQDTIEVYPT